MDEYCITRDDRDALLELAPDACEGLLRQIPANIKSAFTRRYFILFCFVLFCIFTISYVKIGC